MFNTCHPCNYAQDSIEYQKVLDSQFEALFGDIDFKDFIIRKLKDDSSTKANTQASNKDGLTVEQIDLF